MSAARRKKDSVPAGTFREFYHSQLNPNPQNPRRLFDKAKLEILEDSIRKNGILVPLTVYEERNNKCYILDGERRWKCAEKISNEANNPKAVKIPANVVDPPSKVANILCMFNIHNLREQWELMPTALSLQILMKEMDESQDEKIAELTKLSVSNVRRCKTLLSFPPKYQRLMMDPDPKERLKANFFIELKPVLDLYEKLPKYRRDGKTRNELTGHFLSLYRENKIRSVIHFRRILEAHDYLSDDEDRYDEFLSAMQKLASHTRHSIRQLFDPLVAEDKSAATAEAVCRDFLKRLRNLKISHTTKRGELRRLLNSVHKHVTQLLEKLEG